MRHALIVTTLGFALVAGCTAAEPSSSSGPSPSESSSTSTQSATPGDPSAQPASWTPSDSAPTPTSSAPTGTSTQVVQPSASSAGEVPEHLERVAVVERDGIRARIELQRNPLVAGGPSWVKTTSATSARTTSRGSTMAVAPPSVSSANRRSRGPPDGSKTERVCRSRTGCSTCSSRRTCRGRPSFPLSPRTGWGGAPMGVPTSGSRRPFDPARRSTRRLGGPASPTPEGAPADGPVTIAGRAASTGEVTASPTRSRTRRWRWRCPPGSSAASTATA